jgi:hypothetical protein
MKKSMLSILLISLLVGCRHETRDEKYQRQAREFTESSCPKPMDKYTVLDSLIYDIEGRVMTYYYSVSGILDSNSVYSSEFLAEFHSNLLDNIQHNAGLVDLKKHAVTFRYNYASSTSSKVYMSFTIGPSTYN